MTEKPQFPATYEGARRLVHRLRDPGGCPWDGEQTADSLKRFFLEECYELVEAIEQRDPRKTAEELGDVLFNLLFQIKIGVEDGTFDEAEVFGTVIEKLVRRHPHVFGDVDVADSTEVKANWDQIKRRERPDDASILDGVPRTMPALAYARSVQERAARTGFDWEDADGVIEKLAEEVTELREAPSQAEVERELGDVLFSLVNAARWMGVEPEEALRHANARFFQRFSAMERTCRRDGVSLPDLSLDRKNELWERAKRAVG
jgi:tetrapyrrole methylase family protein/MazG family protein